MALRLTRLRELARNTDDGGLEEIKHLLEQEPDNPDVSCPRFAGIAENLGLRPIVIDDDPQTLSCRLCDLALDEVAHQPEAIIDLDTDTRHDAHRTIHLRFRPELPGAPGEPLVSLPFGSRSALRLILEVAEANNDEDNQALREAIALGDLILQRIPAPLRRRRLAPLRPPAVPRCGGAPAACQQQNHQLGRTQMTTITTRAAAPATIERPISSPGYIATLATTTTQDRPDGGIDNLDLSTSVELTDSPHGLGRRLPGQLTHGERTLLGDELFAYPSRQARGTVVLERMFDRGDGLLAHFEARIIPLTDRERVDLEELLGDSDTELAQAMGRDYAAELNDAWAADPSRPPVSVCFLEDIGRTTATAAAVLDAALLAVSQES
jgi:hypothetical protein